MIQNLNSNKAHGHDNISVKMNQMYGDSIIPPLKLIFESAIKSGHSPDSWKKGNIIPIHKKESKYLVKNYRPISLLPIFGKIFEKIIYKILFEYFQENKFISDNQSGFRSGDSSISQLLVITHEIYKTFDANPSLETRGVFLDISKAFDKVWHKGLLFKLKCYGVEGGLYRILKNYLHNPKQRVLLNGQSSFWLDVDAAVRQGSVLGPLLFLIYINYLPENLVSTSKLFADDTSIFSTVFDINKYSENLNKDLATLNDWAHQWRMVSLLTTYKSFIRPNLDYGDIIYDQPHNDTFCRMIESVQYNAALAITGAIRGSSRDRSYQELGLESLSDRRWYRRPFFFNYYTKLSTCFSTGQAAVL